MYDSQLLVEECSVSLTLEIAFLLLSQCFYTLMTFLDVIKGVIYTPLEKTTTQQQQQITEIGKSVSMTFLTGEYSFTAIK